MNKVVITLIDNREKYGSNDIINSFSLKPSYWINHMYSGDFYSYKSFVV